MTGNELKSRREKLGLSQEALARKLNNVATVTVSRWEQLRERHISNKLLDIALHCLESHAKNGSHKA